jgi:hypothetical protein
LILTFFNNFFGSFSSAISTLFMHPGLARTIWTTATGEKKLAGGEHRWYNQFEALAQIQRVGLNKMHEIVEACQQAKCSPESVAKLVVMFDNDAVRGLIDVALSALVEVGAILCSSTYLLEADGVVVFVAHRIFEKYVCLFWFTTTWGNTLSPGWTTRWTWLPRRCPKQLRRRVLQ